MMATKPKRKRIQIVPKPKLMFSTDLNVKEPKESLNNNLFLNKTN